MIVFVLLFTAAVTVITATDSAPEPGQKTTKELHQEGLGHRSK